MTSQDLPVRPRVVLVAGPGGAGSSSAAAVLADLYASRGRRTGIADLDPWHGATTRTTDPALEQLTLTRDRFVDPVARVLDTVGLDRRLAAEAATASGPEVLAMVHLLGTVDQTDLDVVVVDLGARLLEVLEWADRLPWATRHLLRAQRGWLSSTRPRTAPWLSWWPGTEAHHRIRDLGARSEEWAQAVRHAEIVLVGDCEDRRLRRLVLGAALHEMAVTGPVDAETVGTWQDLPCPERPRPGSLVDEDGWTWRLDLPGLRAADLRVERSGDDLALEVVGVRRLVTLPSALRRFPATTARLSHGRLDITFGREEHHT